MAKTEQVSSLTTLPNLPAAQPNHPNIACCTGLRTPLSPISLLLRRGFGLVIATLLCAFALPAVSDTSAGLSPHSAQYKLVLDGKGRFETKAIRKLTSDAEQQWSVSLKASTFIASFSEITRFRLDDQGITPLTYDKKSKVFTKKTERQLRYDWSGLQLTNGEQQWPLSLTQPIYDSLSYQLQLQLDLAQGKPSLSYQVNTGEQLETYQFERIGNEKVSVGYGTLDTVRVERTYAHTTNAANATSEKGAGKTTRLWFAPSLNYQLVKLERVNKKGQTTHLTLEKILSR